MAAPSSLRVLDPSFDHVWRVYDRRTGAFVGEVTRGCKTAQDARERASLIYQLPMDDVGVVLER